MDVICLESHCDQGAEANVTFRTSHSSHSRSLEYHSTPSDRSNCHGDGCETASLVLPIKGDLTFCIMP